jgi:hypothetical protein
LNLFRRQRYRHVVVVFDNQLIAPAQPP